MLSFCTSPHGIVDDDGFAGAERRNGRQRRTSLPQSSPHSASVRRAASYGGNRGASAGRAGGRENLKALIGAPTNFVHVKHDSDTPTKEPIWVDINIMQRQMAQRRGELSSPIAVIPESQAEEQPSFPVSSTASLSASYNNPRNHPGIPSMTGPNSRHTAPSDARSVDRARRASRKPVRYGEGGEILSTSPSSTSDADHVSPLGGASHWDSSIRV